MSNLAVGPLKYNPKAFKEAENASKGTCEIDLRKRLH